MRFVKMHGLGNDFVIVEADELPSNTPDLARRICDRHFGVGADGLVFIMPSHPADLRMQIFNPDGSEAEMCGNAIRCISKHAFQSGLTDKPNLTVETGAGILRPRLIFNDNKINEIEVDMGEPILERNLIPMNGPPGRVVDEPLSVAALTFRVTAVSFGNPHCVIFIPDVKDIAIDILGPEIENHPAFPRRTNVEFVQIINPQEIRVLVWERGAGATLACGTGACASAVAANLNGLTGRSVRVVVPGGALSIDWGDNNHIYMTGPATEVFRGDWPEEPV
ncbi:MAG: diaminopimelate epimerase [Bacillota bacterium]